MIGSLTQTSRTGSIRGPLWTRPAVVFCVVLDVCVRESIMDPALDVCVREPIMDPVLDVCVRAPIMDPVLDVCVRAPIMDPVGLCAGSAHRPFAIGWRAMIGNHTQTSMRGVHDRQSHTNINEGGP